MHIPRPTRWNPRGNRSLPAIIFLGSCGVSAALFFLVTKQLLKPAPEPTAPVVAGDPATTPSQPGVAALPAPLTPAASPPAVAVPPPVPAAPVASKYLGAPQLAGEIAKALQEGRWDDAAKLSAGDDVTRETLAKTVFQKLFTEMGLKPGAGPLREIGQIGDKRLYSLPLEKDGVKHDITLQLVLDPAKGWRVGGYELPFALRDALADATPATPALPSPAGQAPMAPLFQARVDMDALRFSDSFLQALVARDFEAALAMTDEGTVPQERIAGMCILMEESGYLPAKERPLVTTVSTPTNAWVIARLEASGQETTDFGLELRRTDEAQPWKISGLNLSNLLAAYSKKADADVPYTPLVEKPNGGESIVVYFAYDDAALHERAKRQLEIIAGLLKTDPTRKITISGFTDALGTDDYNVRLSRQRAIAVLGELNTLGVPEAQIETFAKGKEQPLSPNTTDQGLDNPMGRARNRRAEIFLNF